MFQGTSNSFTVPPYLDDKLVKFFDLQYFVSPVE